MLRRNWLVNDCDGLPQHPADGNVVALSPMRRARFWGPSPLCQRPYSMLVLNMV